MLQILTKLIFKFLLIFLIFLHILQVRSIKTDVKAANFILDNFIIPFSKIDGIGHLADALNTFYHIFQKPVALVDYCKTHFARIGK